MEDEEQAVLDGLWDQLEELEREEARDSFAVYAGRHIPAEVEKDDLDALHELPLPARYLPAEHHQLLCSKLQDIADGKLKRLMVFMPPGSAKALALDTPIPTPSGWKLMGELRLGDQVFDERGLPCNVTWVSDVHRNRPVFRVATDCGDEIIADHDHEWLVRLSGNQRKPLKGGGKGRPGMKGRDDRASRFKIKETWELCRSRSKRPMIDRAMALQLPPADLPLDPYVLGVWLGDGTSASGSVTSSDSDRPWMRAEIERLGYTTTDRAARCLFGVAGIRKRLVALGVLHDPAHGVVGEKHIPAAYMRASEQQRLALLQGLIDTDGTVCRKRGCATFCNTNRRLAEQVRELVRSLGRKAGWSEGRAVLDGKDCGPVFRVMFYHEQAARLPRKRALCRDQYRTPNTYIDVTAHGIADTVCIEVDSPSHLFLCGRSMTPTHNSTYVSALFPAYYLGKHPNRCVIQGSYNADLADRFGRRARNAFASQTHQDVFQVPLAKGAAGEWETAGGGEYFSFGMKTGVTGRRADCLPAGTKIHTYAGSIGIEDVKVGTPSGYVLSYDEEHHRPVYRRVLAVARRTADELYRIRTSAGHVVEATGNHRFHVNGRWAQASTVTVGDVLLRVLQGADSAAGLRNGEEGSRRNNDDSVQQFLRNEAEQRGARNALGADLQQLRRGAIGSDEATHLLGRVSAGHSGAQRSSGTAGSAVRVLRRDVQTEKLQESILQHGMQEPWPCGRDRREGKPGVAARNATAAGAAALSASIQEDAPSNHRAGRRAVRGLSEVAVDGGSSHQHEPDGSPLGKSGDALRRVPHTLACGGAVEAALDTVAVVERVRRECVVYDIEVEDTHCFFANGLLVHNCVILDDVIKGRKEADSKVERESVWETYKADVRTRMKPGAAIVYVATRWHEDDPAGRILPKNWNGQSGWVTAQDGERWYVLSLVAVVETQEEQDYDPLGRKIGEWIWPEWFHEGFFAQEKVSQGHRNWNALYQQKPKAEEGAILKRSWWRLWKEPKPPKCEYIMSVYDTAFEPDERDDYSARTTWGIFWLERPPPADPPKSIKTGRPLPTVPRGQWCAILLERWKDKAEFPDLRRIAQEHYEKYKPDRVLVEKKSSGHSLIQELRRAGVPVRALAADKSKLARANAASVVLEQGAVYYPDRDWAREVIDDCVKATFIKGDPGNDIGDTCVYAWLHMRNLFWLQLEDEDDEPEEPRRELRLGYGT